MCKQRDIYMANLGGEFNGSLQAGIRPVIIMSNDKANRYSPVVQIIPITSRKNKKNLPVHVAIYGCGLPQSSTALAEQIISINQTQLIKKIGVVSMDIWEKTKEAVKIQLAV